MVLARSLAGLVAPWLALEGYGVLRGQWVPSGASGFAGMGSLGRARERERRELEKPRHPFSIWNSPENFRAPWGPFLGAHRAQKKMRERREVAPFEALCCSVR